jgi:hypothetical protein
MYTVLNNYEKKIERNEYFSKKLIISLIYARNNAENGMKNREKAKSLHIMQEAFQGSS